MKLFEFYDFILYTCNPLNICVLSADCWIRRPCRDKDPTHPATTTKVCICFKIMYYIGIAFNFISCDIMELQCIIYHWLFAVSWHAGRRLGPTGIQTAMTTHIIRGTVFSLGKKNIPMFWYFLQLLLVGLLSSAMRRCKQEMPHPQQRCESISTSIYTMKLFEFYMISFCILAIL